MKIMASLFPDPDDDLSVELIHPVDTDMVSVKIGYNSLVMTVAMADTLRNELDMVLRAVEHDVMANFANSLVTYPDA